MNSMESVNSMDSMDYRNSMDPMDSIEDLWCEEVFGAAKALQNRARHRVRQDMASP